MKVEYRAPRNEVELDDTIDCSVRAFGDVGDRRDRFTNFVIRDPWFDLNNTRACFVEGKCASVVQVFDRPMRIGNCVVRMGAVGSVGTDPIHRRTGYSAEVVRDSIQYMRAAGYDLSMLSTGIQSHYAKAGWVVYPTYNTEVTLPSTLGKLPSDVTIEQYEPNRDLLELIPIFDQFNTSRTGTFLKNERYWLNRPTWRPYDPSLYWIAKQGEKTVAYLLTERWKVGEFGYLPDAQDAMYALFCHFFQCAEAVGVQQIDAPVPSESRKIFETMGCAVRRREQTNIMARIINLESLLTKIKPLLESRLRASNFSGWTGAIRIRYEADERTLVICKGEISVASNSVSPQIDLPISQTQLLQLLCGNMSAEQVVYSNDLQGIEIGLLDALFPVGELFIWWLDRF